MHISVRFTAMGLLLGLGIVTSGDDHFPAPLDSKQPAVEFVQPSQAVPADADDIDSPTSPATTPFATRTIYDVQFTSPQTRATDQGHVYAMPTQPITHHQVNWVSHRTVHRTLYFQDNPLERHGRTNSTTLQPMLSVVRFATDALLAPVRSVHQRANALHYANSPR